MKWEEEEQEEEVLSQKWGSQDSQGPHARVNPSLLWHEPAQRVWELPHGSRRQRVIGGQLRGVRRPGNP